MIESIALEKNAEINQNPLLPTKMKKKKEKIETIALDTAEIQAQNITQEIKTDQGIDVIEEGIVQNMNLKIDIGQDIQEPLALIIKGVKINPAMEEGEGTAKRP